MAGDQDEREKSIKMAVEVATAKFMAQVESLVDAIEKQKLAGMGLVAVDTDGSILVNFVTVHPLITQNIYWGMSSLLEKVEGKMREDGTWIDKFYETAEDDEALGEEEEEAASPKLQ